MSAPSSAQTCTAYRLGGCPRTACTPAERISMSLRLQSDDEKALPRSGCDKYYLCRQRGRFSRFARRERAPTNLKANGSKSIECLARHDDFSAAMTYGGYEAVVSCSHLTARYLQVEPVPEIKD